MSRPREWRQRGRAKAETVVRNLTRVACPFDGTWCDQPECLSRTWCLAQDFDAYMMETTDATE